MMSRSVETTVRAAVLGLTVTALIKRCEIWLTTRSLAIDHMIQPSGSGCAE